MIVTETEQDQALMVGKCVCVTHLIAGIERQYHPVARVDARLGKVGKIIGYSNSHGICYDVKHYDGTVASYEPEELTLI